VSVICDIWLLCRFLVRVFVEKVCVVRRVSCKGMLL